MSFQPGAMVYTQGFGSRPEDVEVPHIDTRAPSSSDTLYPLGKDWVDKSSGSTYRLTQKTSFNGVLTAYWAFLGSSSGDLNTLTTDDLTIVSPSNGNINLSGDGSITTVGSGDTATVELTGLTNHNVLIGAGTTTITKVAPSATSGVALVSQGAAADPDFGTVVVAGGGTGATTLTGVLTGNGTSAVTANAVTQHGVLLGGASNAVGSLAVAATGTVLAGSTGADPAFTGSPSVSGSITAGTTLTATLGNITATNGNLVLAHAGNLISVKGGAATDFIGQATLALGTKDVANTSITANDRVIVTRSAQNGSTAYGTFLVTITPSTKFNITACKSDTTTETGDTSIVDYIIVRQS